MINLAHLAESITERHAELMEELKQEFIKSVEPWMIENNIVAIGWRQYTPYFNDGDTCYFGIYGVSMVYNTDFNGEIGQSYGETIEDLLKDSAWISDELHWNDDLCKSLATLLYTLPDSILIDLFNDHQSVVGYIKDNALVFRTDWYEHD